MGARISRFRETRNFASRKNRAHAHGFFVKIVKIAIFAKCKNRDFSRFLSQKKNRESSRNRAKNRKISRETSREKSSDFSRKKLRIFRIRKNSRKIHGKSQISRKTCAHFRSKFGQFWPNFDFPSVHPSRQVWAAVGRRLKPQTPDVPATFCVVPAAARTSLRQGH